MSAARGLAVFILAAGGAYALYRLEQDKLQATAPPAPTPRRRSNGIGTLGALLGVVGGLIGDGGGLGGSSAPAGAVLDGIYAGGGATGSTAPLLNAIAPGESGAAGYNAIYSKIRASDRPRKPLTQMTVAQVLAWQDSIDARYPSEASGRYQFLEDTLRGLSFNPNALFNAATQDKLADQLLVRRGLNAYRAGSLTAEAFCANLAKEWASIGVPYAMQGQKRRVARGESYYAGDGLNRAFTSPDKIIAAIKRI